MSLMNVKLAGPARVHTAATAERVDSMKTIIVAAALAVSLAFGAGQAQEAQAQEARTPPQMRLMDMLMLGEGTVVGTVKRVGAKYLSLSDGQQIVDVTSKEFLFDGVKEGDRLTVTGTASRGTVKPTEILKADGTPLPKREGK